MEYIKGVVRTESLVTIEMAQRATTHLRPIHACFGLTTETGELTDGFKRHIFYGTPLDTTNIKEEIGDIFWYIGILCDWAGISFEECQAANLAKLKARYPEKFDSEKAVDRNLAAERESIGAIPQAFHAEEKPIKIYPAHRTPAEVGKEILGVALEDSKPDPENPDLHSVHVQIASAGTDFPTDGGWKNKPDITPEFSGLNEAGELVPPPAQIINCPNCNCSQLRVSTMHPGKKTCNQCGHHF